MRGQRHHSKPVSAQARRSVIWPAALVAAVILACGTAYGFGGHFFFLGRHPSSHQTTVSPARKRAEKDVQVGTFYLKSGRYYAAISRFKGAITHDPSWAVPHELLGEAYEKNRDPQRAIAEYREYLKMAPHAKDARKIERRVQKLTREENKRSSTN